MELHVTGKTGAPAVLLIPDRGTDGAAFAAALSALEKNYLLLIPAFAGDETDEEAAAALASALGQQYAGRVWGAYGLRGGATLLLALLSRGAVRAATVITEGAFTLPAAPLPTQGCRYVCWVGGGDKAAKKAWKALGKRVSPLSSLTLKKLKKGQDLLSVRPDLMVKRLEKAFGKTAVVSRSAVMEQRAEKVWREICLHPDREEARFLTEMEPLRRSGEQYTQLAEGRSGRLKRWSHWVRLESLGEDGTICTDQVELDAGKLNALAKPAAKLYLARVQRRRARALRKG